MNDQQYKDRIQFLIDALNEFKTKEKIEAKVFDGILGADIQDTVFEIIREHNIETHPDYKNFSKKEFEKLSLEDEIEALQKVIDIVSAPGSGEIPSNIKEMMEVLDEKIDAIEKIPVEQRQRIPIDQTFEARFRRAFEYSRRQQEINGLVSDDEVLIITATRANEVKAVAKEDPKKFTEEIVKVIQQKTNTSSEAAQEAARIYVEEYVGKSRADQNIATLSPSKIAATAASKKPTALYEILNIGGEVAKTAEAVVLVGAIANEPASKQIAEEIKRDPQAFEEKLATQILGQVVEPTTSRRIEVERNVRTIAAQYTEKVVAGVNPQIDTGRVKEILEIPADTELPEQEPQVLIQEITTKFPSLTQEKVETAIAQATTKTQTENIPVIDANLVKAQVEAGNINITLDQVQRESVEPVIEFAAEKPQELKSQLRENILGEKVLNPQEDKIFNNAVDTYVAKLASAKDETVIMIATAEAAAALEPITGSVQTENLLNAVQPQNIVSGENAELVKLIVQAKTIEQAGQVVVPVIPIINDEKTIEVLNERFTTNATEPPVLNVTQEAQASGFLATSLGQFYVDTGVAKMGQSKDPNDVSTAIATQLRSKYGVTSGTTSSFRLIQQAAIRNGVSMEQINLLKNKINELTTAANEGTLNWSKVASNGKLEQLLQATGLNAQMTQSFMSGGKFNFSAVAPQHNFLGGTVFRVGQQFFGGQAERLIKGSINKGLQKAAERIGGVVLEKAAATGVGKAIGGVAVALGIVGTAGAAALVAGGMWLWDKAKFVIHSRSGQILATIGGLIGGLIAGPVGLLIGAGIGAQIAGIDWKKWGKRIGWVLKVLAAYFLARLILPIIIAASILIGGTIFVSLVIFIINSGAYVIPTGIGGQFGSVPGGKIQCFVLTGFSQANLDIEKQVIEKMSVATSYMSKLCKDGDITVKYEAEQAYGDNGKPYGGFVTDGGTIIHIYNIGLLSVSNAFYTLTHETGHVFDHRYPDVKTAFRDDPQVHAEGYVCTYPFGSSLTEDFAESIAGYFSTNPVSVYRDFSCMKGQSFQNKYPGHWKFMNENLFGEQVVQ